MYDLLKLAMKNPVAVYSRSSDFINFEQIFVSLNYLSLT